MVAEKVVVKKALFFCVFFIFVRLKKYFAFYFCFGVIDDPFYMDVHSINNKNYLNKLKKVSNETGKDVYGIFDDGVLIYDRNAKEIYKYGNVIKFTPINKEEV